MAGTDKRQTRLLNFVSLVTFSVNRHRLHHAQVLHLGFFEDLADVVDVAAGHPIEAIAKSAVPFLVLSQSGAHPELRGNLGNIALLERAEQVGLLPGGVGHAAANAYRELRRVQHRARLDEAPTQVEPPALQAERDAVLALWQAVFGAGL